MEEDNYGFKKVMMVFSILGIIIIIAVMFISNNHIDNNTNYEGESFAVVVGPTPTLIYSDTDENGVYTSSPNIEDVEKTYYTVTIDGVSSIVALDTNRVTDKEWIINKTVVGNDKENITLVEYMREDGTTYEKVE